MQTELEMEDLAREVRILGVNSKGAEAGNSSVCEGRDLPWLQDTADEDVWGLWAVTYRDVVVADHENRVFAVYNLTEHDLTNPANYEALKAILRDAAGAP